MNSPASYVHYHSTIRNVNYWIQIEIFIYHCVAFIASATLLNLNRKQLWVEDFRKVFLQSKYLGGRGSRPYSSGAQRPAHVPHPARDESSSGLPCPTEKSDFLELSQTLRLQWGTQSSYI